MNLRDMHYLVTVADLRHFSRAAEHCHVSQPTLSNQIKKLEEQLGVVLFERTNKQVLPTEYGEQIVANARRILYEVEAMKALAQAAQDPLAGPFRLGAFPTLATYIFPSLVPQITEALPRMRLILVEEKTATLVDLLRAGKLDAALLALPLQEDGLEETALFEDAFFVATPPGHPLAEQKQVTMEDLHTHSLLLLEEGHCLREQALEVCHMAGIGEAQDVRATGLETLRYMVKAGTGITLMPHIAMKQNEAGICYLPFAEPAPSRTIGLVWRKTTHRKAAMDQLVEMMRVL